MIVVRNEKNVCSESHSDPDQFMGNLVEFVKYVVCDYNRVLYAYGTENLFLLRSVFEKRGDPTLFLFSRRNEKSIYEHNEGLKLLRQQAEMVK